jgi:hypothetical protein
VLDAAGELAAYRKTETELPTLAAPVPGRP